MNALVMLLCAYGITFGLQNKLAFLHARFDWLDSLLRCTYCAGFHGGWITYLIFSKLEMSSDFVFGMVGFAFASSAFCYLADTSARLMESYADPLYEPEK